MQGETILQFRHVHVARGLTTVLHDIDLTIRRGEHLAILGPNGCGKSTLLKAMTCEIYPLVRPETQVEIFGRQRWDLTQLRRKLGVVAAELPGKPTRKTTGLDAVISGFFSSSTLWPNLTVTDDMRQRSLAMLDVVGGGYLSEKLVGEMSAGQQRRIMIARALVASDAEHASDRILLLDEPSNALDMAAQRDLRRTMSDLARQGTTIILITHHLQDILPEMNRVVAMSEGRIVADGDKQSVLTSANLSSIFGGEVTVAQRDQIFYAW